MIRFACPSCGAKVAAPEQLAGRKAPCKRCGETIRVPAAPPATAIAARRKEPCTEAASAPTPWENLAPEVLPLFKTPRPTQLLVVIGLLASILVLGLIGAGAGCYYFVYLPYAHKTAPIQNPVAPTPPAVDAAGKDAALQNAEIAVSKETAKTQRSFYEAWTRALDQKQRIEQGQRDAEAQLASDIAFRRNLAEGDDPELAAIAARTIEGLRESNARFQDGSRKLAKNAADTAAELVATCQRDWHKHPSDFKTLPPSDSAYYRNP
jgi:hypothetical protein